ncbi:ABC transporter ATP-binding protein [Sphaerisporangium corydalis]|uniref:ATP-binding cassette domain-containing protein n=1 Tax=Sphaerisporangium corydalis TaxID=1441875 RepID=A0ABV9EIY4_9ACTN|nr:ABC transporter ATP-binding protein [Sphaerisporangium corydalis]
MSEFSPDHDGISVRRLVREFRSRTGPPSTAVDDLSFDVRPGELVTLLGHNGAGKTTTARVLVTLLEPTSGSAWVAGADVRTRAREVRRRCGFSFGGDTGLYPRLSAEENLRFFATLHRLGGAAMRRRCATLLDQVGLADRAGDRVESLSHGLRQRLHIARSLLHDPPVLVLDEPSSGIDPVAARDIRAMLRSLAADGRAVLLTTHDLVEAEQLSHRVLVLRKGRLVAEATPSRLRQLAANSLGTRIEVEFDARVEAEILRDCPGLKVHEPIGSGWSILVSDGAPATSWLLTTFGSSIVHLNVSPPSLEDAYVELVGSV